MTSVRFLLETDVGEFECPPDVRARYEATRMRKRDGQPDRRFKEGRALHDWFWQFNRQKTEEYFQNG